MIFKRGSFTRFLIGIALFAFSSLVAIEPPPRKVLCVTIPKSGSHLLKKALEMISGSKFQWISAEKFPSIEDLKSAPESFFMVHSYPTVERARFFDSHQFAKIVLVRDPRDVMVSFLYHIGQKKKWSYPSNFDHARFFSLSFDEQLRETLLFPYPNPLDALPYAIAWMSDPAVFVCRFEDLVGEKGGGSRESQQKMLMALASFIGTPITKERADQIGNVLFGGTWTFRKGQIGEGKKAYSTENKHLFQSLTGKMMQDLGYGDDENW
jgi:hypothetical protein